MLERFQQRLTNFWASPMPMFLSALLGPALFGLFILIFVQDEITTRPTKNPLILLLTSVGVALLCMWGTVIWLHSITPYVALGSVILLICLGSGWYSWKIVRHLWKEEVERGKKIAKVFFLI